MHVFTGHGDIYAIYMELCACTAKGVGGAGRPCLVSGGDAVGVLQGLKLGFATEAPLPDLHPILVEGHLRVQCRASRPHQLRHGRHRQVAPGVVEEGER